VEGRKRKRRRATINICTAGSEDQIAGKDHRERSDSQMDGPLAEEIKIRNRTGDWITITNSAHIEFMSETLPVRVGDALGVPYCDMCALYSHDPGTIVDDRAMVFQFHHGGGGGGCWEGLLCPSCEEAFDKDELSIQCQGDDDDEDFPSCEGTKCICMCNMLDCKAAVTRGTYVVKPSSW